jgi:Cysteine-rich secretory protein family
MRAALLTLISLALLTPLAQAQSPNEQALVDLANKTRAEHNLKPLAWDPALAKAAQFHLAVVIKHPGIPEHEYPGEPDLIARAGNAGAHFSTVAENIAGNAQDANQIHATWMSTPTHRANLLDPRLTVVGIAVTGAPGALYAVQDFGVAVADLNSPNGNDNANGKDASGPEKQVQQLLVAHNIQPNTSAEAKQAARANCDSGATPPADAAHPAPTLIMQWESSDLTQLPAQLLQHLPANSQKPQTAAVGSCSPKQPAQGFTSYRLAVLIY